MGLFSKEACTFCNTEVGALKRSKLATKEFICNDCKRKTNYFARMDYTSRDGAQRMMDTLAQEAADFEASFNKAENRWEGAERSWNSWYLGRKRVSYRCNTRLGAFQLLTSEIDSYENVPVFYFDQMIPYAHQPEGAVFAGSRRMDVLRENAEYVTVQESKDPDGKIKSYTLEIPYNDACIREIKLSADVNEEKERAGFQSLADQINEDRRRWLGKAAFDAERKNKMQVRNLGDTAAEAMKAAVTGGDVKEVLKKGVDTANDIEEGKVKQGFFGKLFKK